MSDGLDSTTSSATISDLGVSGVWTTSGTGFGCTSTTTSDLDCLGVSTTSDIGFDSASTTTSGIGLVSETGLGETGAAFIFRPGVRGTLFGPTEFSEANTSKASSNPEKSIFGSNVSNEGKLGSKEAVSSFATCVLSTGVDSPASSVDSTSFAIGSVTGTGFASGVSMVRGATSLKSLVRKTLPFSSRLNRRPLSKTRFTSRLSGDCSITITFPESPPPSESLNRTGLSDSSALLWFSAIAKTINAGIPNAATPRCNQNFIPPDFILLLRKSD